MSAPEITVPQSEHQTAVDAVIDAVTANRNGPPAATAARPQPSMKYNTATGVVEYFSEADARLAEQPADISTLDGSDLQYEQEALVAKLGVEIEKLNAYTHDPVTGAKVFKIAEGSEARRVQEMQIAQLMGQAEYQQARFNEAIAAREAQGDANARAVDALAIANSWTGGSPRKAAILAEEVERAEARHIADAVIRAKLGNLGS
jgi:hypothetical protein